MLSRRLLVMLGAVAAFAATPTIAMAASWGTSGAGSTAAAGGTLAAPTGVTITGCTATGKSGGNVTGTVTVTWTVSSTSQTTGQKAYIGSTASKTYANNTTASDTLTYTGLAPAAYTVGISGTRATAWESVIANSTKKFNPSTSGPNGSCTVT